MNFNIAIHSLFALLLSLFAGESNPPTVDPSIYTKTVDVQKKCDQVLFDETLDAYNEFYNHSCKHVKIKMGKVSRIQQQLSTDPKLGNVEVVYNETIKLENKSIALTSEIVELHIYNRRKSTYEIVGPGEIALSSKRATAIEKHKESIRAKSDKLFSFLTKKK